MNEGVGVLGVVNLRFLMYECKIGVYEGSVGK